MSLRTEPRRVVVAGHFEVESRLFGGDGITDKVFWPALLCHQGIAETCHTARVPATGRRETSLWSAAQCVSSTALAA
ncbi:Uncharacterised protein [Mycobacteroides abscessus subsp. abscessus]|nr:Uncharacterised protein [Mycobacteroides abscessus subsp. abscessus]